jgi:hypothetical protein
MRYIELTIIQAVSVLYRLTLYRKGGKDGKVEEYEATCHSCWRQTAYVIAGPVPHVLLISFANLGEIGALTGYL